MEATGADRKKSKNKSKGSKRPRDQTAGSNSTVDYDSLDDHSKRIIQVRLLMKERDEARAANNFLKADDLRSKLTDMGVFVIDQKDGPSGWKFLDGSSNKLRAGTKIPDAAEKKRKRNDDSDPPEKVKTATSKAQKAEKSGKKQKQSVDSAETSRNRALLQAATGAAAAPVVSGARVVDGVNIIDVAVGSGKEASYGNRVKVHYVGKLKTTSKVFDASKKPFAFRLGRGEVIRGWDIGVKGMRVGGHRVLTIPPEKAYGPRGAPPTIPGNAW
eukprot:CAMPEP_0185035424 /NCGR_PEP_ID=MMETSP1103-20130426/26762_1 /TAXON_ID=36769 /ORGANISM="Paraphysomonas bandaiensis, Strain Caron Lab Isolate" /LENGTH=271 /DNA_ID=CAMNT_0027572489 /DNA_START=18 /DNA_END=830 /DNA_ORIENTATION=-